MMAIAFPTATAFVPATKRLSLSAERIEAAIAVAIAVIVVAALVLAFLIVEPTAGAITHPVDGPWSNSLSLPQTFKAPAEILLSGPGSNSLAVSN